MEARPGYEQHTESDDRVDDDDTNNNNNNNNNHDDDDENSEHHTGMDLLPYIPGHQLNAMNELVGRAISSSPTTTAALLYCLEALPGFGVSEAITLQCRELVIEIQAGFFNAKSYAQKVRQLKHESYHCYNLLNGIAELLKEKQRIRHHLWLPAEITAFQLQAVRQRIGLNRVTSDEWCLSDSVHLIFCPVCDSVYSLLREFNSMYVNNYGYGLRDAIVEYTTDRLFCRRSKVNHRGRCDQQELCKIPLLGRILYFGGKNIMLCPQPACGLPMVIDYRKCAWTEYGPACCDCTFKLESKRLDYGQIDFMTVCAKCNMELTRTDTIYLYPYGVALCQRHHKQFQPHLGNWLGTALMVERCRDRRTTIDAIVEFYRKRKAERVEMSSQYNNWVLKQSKMRTRSRK
jgi:hypothetical protein